MHTLAHRKRFPIIPVFAGIMVSGFLVSRLMDDSVDKAAARLEHALITKNHQQLYNFVDQDEKTALALDEKSFAKLLNLTLFKSYKLDSSVHTAITKFSSQRVVTISDLSDKSGRSLPVAVVGEPGRFRVPGFVEFCLQASSAKENYNPKLAGGEAKMTALRNYLAAHQGELEAIGIQASFDPSQGIVRAFGPRIAQIDEKLMNAR